MKIVSVSSLEVRKHPKKSSKVYIKRGSTINIVGPPIIINNECWILIETPTEPIIKGYVLNKYLTPI